MIREQRLAVSIFAVGMIALGILSVISRDFAYTWQPVPQFHPGREILAVTCGSFMIAASIALLFRSTVHIAARAMFVYLLAWMCLKVPAIFVAPQIEGVWLGLGELGMLFAGGWVLLAEFSEVRVGIRIAQIIFGLAVIPVGLSHLFYLHITASLVPSWLPFRTALAAATGVAQIVCGLGMLFAILPGRAAYIETGLLGLFGFLVWGPDTWFAATPKMAGSPAGPRFPLTAFLITWVIGASALLIARSSAPESSRLNLPARNPDEQYLSQ
jgi:uncharacterized membrane protein